MHTEDCCRRCIVLVSRFSEYSLSGDLNLALGVTARASGSLLTILLRRRGALFRAERKDTGAGNVGVGG